MTSPETLELEAVDAALAGRYVAPEHAELADLALLLRDERPQPAPAWATHLDRRVEAGFPAKPKPCADGLVGDANVHWLTAPRNNIQLGPPKIGRASCRERV